MCKIAQNQHEQQKKKAEEVLKVSQYHQCRLHSLSHSSASFSTRNVPRNKRFQAREIDCRTKGELSLEPAPAIFSGCPLFNITFQGTQRQGYLLQRRLQYPGPS